MSDTKNFGFDSVSSMDDDLFGMFDDAVEEEVDAMDSGDSAVGVAFSSNDDSALFDSSFDDFFNDSADDTVSSEDAVEWGDVKSLEEVEEHKENEDYGGMDFGFADEQFEANDSVDDNDSIDESIFDTLRDDSFSKTDEVDLSEFDTEEQMTESYKDDDDESGLGEVDSSALMGDSRDSSRKSSTDEFDIDDMYVNRSAAALGGLLENKTDEETFGFKRIEVSNITVTSNRIRKVFALEKLVMSIQNEGLLVPITVAPTKTTGIYVLVDGLRRLLACAKVGMKTIPCVINHSVSVPEICIVEALSNHSKEYTIQEMLDYIEYIKKEKGIQSSTMIEHLLNMDSGDYNKLMDLVEDDDSEILTPLFGGQMSIQQAFKKLEQKRKKMGKEEKDAARAGKVYGNAEEYGIDRVQGSGDTENNAIGLSDAEVKDMINGLGNLDDVDDEDLNSMIEESNQMEGYKYDKQTSGAREGIDPAIRKAVLTRDGAKCVICGFGGPGLESCIDIHHLVGVAQGQDDNPENCVCLDITCHMLVEQYAYGKLPLTGVDKMDEEQQRRLKRVIKIGNIKRNAMIKLGKKRDEIRKEGTEATQLRRMPGAQQPRA